ncbi:MAG: redoxin domain-containing protein [Bacteroidia bacterium]|nr:redoxin domain-containing protein [Bacteroidia bacterium]
MLLEIGKPAPDFKLFNTDKKEISLSDYKGKNLVVLFFPLAFTGVCTDELCYIRDNYNTYSTLNAEVVAISIDSLFSLGAYKKEQGYHFDLLSDFNKTVSKAYQSLYENFGFGMRGVTKRSAFVIDKNGILQYSEILEDAGKLPNFEAIKACLVKLA